METPAAVAHRVYDEDARGDSSAAGDATAFDGAPDLGPSASGRSRWRVGVGAAVVLVIVALCCAVLVSMFSGRGRTDVVALPSAGNGSSVAPGGGGASTSPGSAGSRTDAGGGPAAGGAESGGAAASGTAAGGAGAGGPDGASQPPILLHVLGAVARPGLYELHTGDRVIDAVAAAGGFSATADQTQQNLARVVADGEQLVIPEMGASPPLGSVAAGAGGAAGSGGSTTSGTGGTANTKPALVNLNTADQTALETLPQVGPALAQRIIAWRTTNGRFAQLDDLKNVTGIGDKTFEALKPLVTI